MAQIEVFEWLKAQRLGGNEAYFSSEEVYKGLGCKFRKFAVYSSLVQLERFNYLEVDKQGYLTRFCRVYRVKKEFIK